VPSYCIDKLEKVQSKLNGWLESALTSAHRKQQISLVNRYRSWCEENSFVPFPPTFNSVGSFLCSKVDSLVGSSKSIDNWSSCIKVYCDLNNIPWLSKQDGLLLNIVKKEIKLQDRIEVKRRGLLTAEVCQDLCQLPTLSLQEYATLTMAVSTHDGLFRGGELCSGLKVKEFVWSSSRKKVLVKLRRSKRCRQGNGEEVVLYDSGKYSAVALLRRWFDINELWKCYDRLVFFDVSAKGVMQQKSITVAQFRNRIKALVNRTGRNGSNFGAHSGRGGGTTDLFRMKVAYAIIKKFGRWKSDACLIYFRDIEEVASSSAAAFKRLRAKLFARMKK